MSRGVAATGLLLVVACACMAGCGGDERAASTQPIGPVVAVIKGLDNPFFTTMRDGLVATSARLDMSLRVDAAADVNDAAGQSARLRSHEEDRAGCYIVSPINTTNLIEPLSRVARNTPIVNIDLPVAQQQATALGVHITTFIATDNFAAGSAAAGAMGGFVPRTARVAVLSGPSGDANSQSRIEGFQWGSEGRFRIVASATADWDRGKARRATADLLAADPHLAGIFAANDLMALGAATAAAAAGRRGKVAIIGVDGIRDALRAVTRGELSATVAQYPYMMGRLGVEACVAAARGARVPSRIDAPLEVVTKRNVTRVESSFPEPLERFDDPLANLLKAPA
jgi:ribose transport system substrate-binding protein